MSDLRDERKALTRDQIVRAALDLLALQDPAAISMPAVAEASGVSLRTVYRYFPSKAELLEAAGVWFNPQDWTIAAGRSRLEDLRPDDLLTYQRTRYADFAANRAAVIAQLSTPGGRELRRQRLGEQRLGVRELMATLVPNLDEPDHHRLADAIITAASSATFVELVDRLELDPGAAADLTVWMIEALMAHATTTGSTRPRGPANEETQADD